MYLRIKGIVKILGVRNNFISKNFKYTNDTTKLFNF